jgi:predicted transglutaminase-like cysteine proteinase
LKFAADILSAFRQVSYMMLSLLLFAVPVKADPAASQVTVDLYGHILRFNLTGDFYRQRSNCFSQDHIAESVDKLIKDRQMDTLISQMNSYATQFGMDDMAYLMMLNKVSNVLMNRESEACRTLFKYATLHKKGLDVFIGYSESSITLYGLTNCMIDNCIYIERGNKKYFDLSFSQQRLPQTEQLFVIRRSGKTVPLVMNMITPPTFNAKQDKKVRPFEYDGIVYFFTAKVNRSLVDYYRELPTIKIGTLYLNYGLSASATQSLVQEIRTATASMSATRSVDFIMRFVQTSFDYKKDIQVYGQEKFSFPEETLMNRYADCEDKAILFASLVNKVLGFKTVALHYKDAEHINIALESWDRHLKSNFVFKDQDYVVCEPSGAGFNIGESATSVNFARLIEW